MFDSSVMKVTGWNVKGLNIIVKLKQVLGRIKQKKKTVCFLQESHLVVKDVGGLVEYSPLALHLLMGWVIKLIHKLIKDKY